MNETIILRANIMGGMNSYIQQLGDEATWMKWIWTYIFPDNITEEDLMEMAEDEDIWLNVVKCFAKCLEIAEK